MRYPEFLKEHGSVGFLAPSFGCATEPYRSAFDHALGKWQEMGYRTVLGPNVYESSGTGISASPEKCGRELTESYLSGESDILHSCGGGELMCEILDYVDFEKIRAARPKWYMGYSDNTNFTFLLTTLCDVASIYGPCAPAFGMEPWHESIWDAYRLLTGEKLAMAGYQKFEIESLKDETRPLEPYHVTEPRQIRVYLPGAEISPETEAAAGTKIIPEVKTASEDDHVRLRGRLIGGCLDCLVNLAGTVYDKVTAFADRYQNDGIIWYLEACDLNVFAIRRALWELDHAGWFRHAKGFLFGRPLCHGQDMMGLDQYRAVTELLAKYNVPILMDLDIGHLPPMMPVINRSMADVCLDGQEFLVSYELC